MLFTYILHCYAILHTVEGVVVAFDRFEIRLSPLPVLLMARPRRDGACTWLMGHASVTGPPKLLVRLGAVVRMNTSA